MVSLLTLSGWTVLMLRYHAKMVKARVGAHVLGAGVRVFCCCLMFLKHQGLSPKGPGGEVARQSQADTQVARQSQADTH